MLPNSGYGADAAAPAVKQIYEGIYGLAGQKAAVAGGKLPGLPNLAAQTKDKSKPHATAKPSAKSSAKATAPSSAQADGPLAVRRASPVARSQPLGRGGRT
jgi:penicillin-binding protein 2